MTEQKKNEQVEQVEELELTSEQLEELLAGSDCNDKLPPFELSIEEFDLKEFQRGIHETSYLCGQITALLNVGLSEEKVLDILLSKETIAHNLEVAHINKDIAKNQKITQDKFEL